MASHYLKASEWSRRLLFSSFFHATAAMKRQQVHVQILPSRRCLFDEPVHIKVEGLAPRQRVELGARLVDDRGVLFTSAATYEADRSGAVDLGTSRSLGGSYTGVEPMGLFWSMQPNSPHTKLSKKDVQKPCAVDVEVFSTSDRHHVLARETNERGFMVPGVRRLPVKVGRIRGTLFVPPAEDPLPGVLELCSLGGGLQEVRGSLLANKGFVVFCLAYYKYDDLPASVIHFDLEYFEEALEFLRSRPEVKGPGVGVLSLSKSGDLALSIASFLPGVSATVCVNGCNGNTVYPLHFRDTVIPAIMVNTSKITVTKTGLLEGREAVDPTAEGNEAAIIPIEKATCSFLLVASEDDRNWNSCFFAKQAFKRLKDHGKKNCEVVTYPKAGHFLEVPYMPLCSSAMHDAVGKIVGFGGDPKYHAEAQVDLWRRIEVFFKKDLNSFRTAML